MTWFVEQLHRDGSVLGRSRVLGPTFRIGRALDNDLVVDDPHCAAHHAALTVDDAHGSAVLQDLETHNGITPVRGKRANTYTMRDDTPHDGVFRAGHTLIRIRNSAWPLPPELALSVRDIWPFALTMLTVVLLHTAWTLWLNDVGEKSPPYLYGIVGVAAGVTLWSGMYALLGRLITGAERFFTHLLIACCGYLIMVFAERALQVLSFAMNWLWPMRIEYSVTVLLIALLVRAHLRVADPRHWPTTRWAIGLATVLALTVPVAQLWISSQRLTNVQTLSQIEHPALRLAKPAPVESLIEATGALKTRVDDLRSKDNTDDPSEDQE